MKNTTSFLFFTLLFINTMFSQNLLTNGNFESGGNGTGFSISNPNYTEISAPFATTTSPGNFAFVTDPQPMNTSNFIAGGDHTSGTGKMLAIDGTTVGGQQRFWRAGNTAGGVCGLTIGKTYQFSYWIKSISNNVTNAVTSADIGVQFTNVTTSALVSGTALASLPALGWRKVVYSFVASAPCVTIEMFNNNVNNVGNDFAIDDLSVFVPLSATFSAISSTCFGANNGSITAYPSNGIAPYVTYAITGATPQTNATGYFSGLTNGIYSLTVTDSNGGTVTVNGIAVTQPTNLVTPFDSAICAGSARILSVSGGTGYLWTASPPDATLTQPTSATPSVSPTVVTTYTVTATTNLAKELVFNGNFSSGNRGFLSDYQYLNPTNTAGITKSYGIVANPSVWWTALSACGDHTTGAGNMMVFNGSDVNAGNDKLWNQKIPVTSAQTYTFSFWVQSLSATNVASIEATINGVSVGTISPLGTAACGNWRQFSFTWNSVASTFADIVLYNRNTSAAGNDFAIDDISFTTAISCNLSKSITLTPQSPATATISGSAISCPGYTSTISVSGTPNASVTIQSIDGTITSSPVILSAAGTGSWITPPINDTTVFKILSVDTPTPGCITYPTGANVTITIILNGCAQTGINGAINNPASIDASCTAGQCRTLTASYTDLKDTSSYLVTSIPYCPLPYDDPSYNQVSLDNDDIWTAPIDLPFNFCFFGNNYNKVQIGSNGVVTFNITNPFPGFSPYAFTNTIPSNSFPASLLNSIYGVLQDIDVRPIYSPASARFSYKLLDTGANAYPCRKLVVNFYNMGQWGCGAASGLQTYQMVLYEVSNVIEVNVLHRQPCASGAANNRAVIGIQNAAGTLAYAPPNRNTGTWTADNESWRFTPNGASIATFGWFQGATPIPYDPITKVAIVCPTVTTTYTASTTYTTCGGVPIVKAKDITVVVNNDPITTQNPIDLVDCDNNYNLTSNTIRVLGTLVPADYDIKYFVTDADVQAGLNPIPFPGTFISAGGQTIYMSITNGPTNCRYFKQFNLINTTLITPTFTQVGPFCIGENFTLPTSSNNTPAITGSWFPAINNTTTTTYTFTPNYLLSPCAVPVQMTVVINNSPTTPTFNAVAPVCSGSTIPALPTTSTNGILGSWSPALNNTATTIYTFAPNSGQCANTQTMTITVNPAITPTFTQVATICSGATLASLPTTSTNGIAGTWSPALNNTATTIYTFAPDPGQCTTTQTMTITVNPAITPTFTQVAAICSGATLAPLPTTSTNGISGSWSPPLNNTATTIYTFTPTAGQCTTTQTMTITVNPIITPTFVQIAPICSGDSFSLPTSSTNTAPIIGNWSPALNNTATTIYTFAPNSGQCANTQTMTITVNPAITPTFTQVAAICSGATLAPFPTTSTDGILGSWSPALNNTATTIYTFVPNSGQCANTQTMTITVNPAITPTFTQVTAICSGTTLAPLPTTSNNGISGSWSPALNNTATTIYTFAPNPGQCTTTQTMTITVNPIVTPTFTQVAAICSGATLAALPTTSVNGITGSWFPPLNNTLTTTYAFTPDFGQCASTQVMTITVNPIETPTFVQIAPICSGAAFSLPTTSANTPAISGSWSPAVNNSATTIYTFTPDNGQCANTQTMTITVNPAITPTFTQVAAICSGTTLAPLPTTSNNVISGSWSPALNNTATTIYTFAPNPGQCTNTQTMTITVNPIVTPTFTQVAAICSGATLAALPTTSVNGITGSWFPPLNNTLTTTYAFTPDFGQCASTQVMTITVNPIVTPTFVQIAPICSGAAFSLPTTSANTPAISGSWSPAVNNNATTIYTFTPDNGQCANTQTMTITVKPAITPTFTQVAAICSGTTLAPLPTSSNNGISGSWSPALNNTTTTIYTFAPNPGQCTNTQTMTITVNPAITLTFTQVAAICSGTTLAPLPTTSNNGISGSWSPALNNTATTIYTFAPNPGQCTTTQTMTVTVNALPIATVEIQNICAGFSSRVEAKPVPVGNYTYEWTVPTGVSNPGSVSNFQTTTAGNYSVIISSVAGCRSASASGNLIITPIATFQAISAPVCEGTQATVSATTLSGVPTDYQYRWTVPVGVTNPGNIDTFYTTVAGTYRVIATSIATNCPSAEVSVVVQINPKPVVTMPQNGYICVDASGATIAGSGSSFVLNTSLSAAAYGFEWFTNNTSNGITTPSFTAVTPGTYKVIVTNLTTLCSATASATIVPSLPPTSITLTASNYFENNQTVSVAVLPAGVYEYQLDGGFYQDGNEFTNVDSGIHEVRVRDKKACGSVGDSILTVDYPHFFTPNGDGFNDKWNVNELKNPSVATILYVYDRYGKLLKQLAVNGEGWDGTYNGSPMLSDDYWFKILYTEKGIAKEFKAHFSLKR